MRAVDLGSGGGALGLPLAVLVPGVEWVLIESSRTRADFLRRAVGRLGLTEVVVCAVPAEVAGRDDGLRAQADVVFARSFGPPATTAECGAPLLRVGGMLAVTEPPEEPGDEREPARWPPAPLETLGLALGPRVGAFQTLCQRERCSDRFPRRTGVPRRRPLFPSGGFTWNDA